MVDAPTVDSVREFFQRPAVSRWGWYLLKAVGILIAVAVLGKLLPIMPSILVGIVWGVLGVLASLGIAYPMVMRKTSKQVEYREGRLYSRVNNGRILRLAFCFVAALILMAGLLFESQKWEPEVWGVIICSAPLYVLVSLAVEKFMATQYEPTFQTKGVVLTSGVLTGLLMLAVYGIFLFFTPLETAPSWTQACVETALPFAHSPSDLLREMGKVSAFGDAATKFAVENVTGISRPIGIGVRLVFCATTFFGISSLLSLCALDWSEIKRIFQPLEKLNAHTNPYRPLLKPCIIWMVILPVAFVVGLVWADSQTNSVTRSEEYKWGEGMVQTIFGISVTEIDGQYYDTVTLEALRQRTANESQDLVDNARATLVPLITTSFKTREDNVDNYLSWYFGPPTDLYSGTGDAKAYASSHFQEYIEKGVDDENLVRSFGEYAEKADVVENRAKAELEICRIDDFRDWEWLTKTATNANPDYLSSQLASSQKISDTYNKLKNGVPPENVADAVAIRVSDLASEKPFSTTLINTINGVGFHPLTPTLTPIEPVNRVIYGDEYRDEVLSCISDERVTLLEAVGVEPPDA